MAVKPNSTRKNFKHVPLDFSSLGNSFTGIQSNINYANSFTGIPSSKKAHSDISIPGFTSGRGNNTSFTASQPDFIKALSEFSGTISGAINN